MKINYSTTKFVIIGAGETGKSIVNYLQQRNAQVLRILDTRDNPPQIAVHQVIGGALITLILPMPILLPLVREFLFMNPFYSRRFALVSMWLVISNYLREKSAIGKSRVIGITGSNGKTTVTSLTGF